MINIHVSDVIDIYYNLKEIAINPLDSSKFNLTHTHVKLHLPNIGQFKKSMNLSETIIMIFKGDLLLEFTANIGTLGSLKMIFEQNKHKTCDINLNQ